MTSQRMTETHALVDGLGDRLKLIKLLLEFSADEGLNEMLTLIDKVTRDQLRDIAEDCFAQAMTMTGGIAYALIEMNWDDPEFDE